jgi:hypothetical protein
VPGDDQPLRLQQREGAGDGAAPGSPPPGVQTIRTNGAYSGTVTFEGCSLGSGGGAEYYRLFTDNSARTFIFSNPAFLDGCGDIAFHATGNALPIRFTGSSLTLRDISVSIRSPATALMDSAFEGPLVSPLTVALERCEFLNGSGTFNLVVRDPATAQPVFTDQPVDFYATNCIWQGAGENHFIWTKDPLPRIWGPTSSMSRLRWM